MDEPTSAISDKEIAVLFGKIDELRRQGTSIIYISHKLDEVFEIADEITVMRDGQIVETGPIDKFDKSTVIALMVGRELSQNYPKEDVP